MVPKKGIKYQAEKQHKKDKISVDPELQAKTHALSIEFILFLGWMMVGNWVNIFATFTWSQFAQFIG